MAIKAGVSPITVSRALNSPDLVRPDTRAKIEKAVTELRYRPNPVAQGLRSGKTRVVLLVVKHKRTYDPLLFEFALGVSDTFQQNNYSLLIHLTPDGSVSVDDVTGRADGVILTDIEENDPRIEKLARHVPVAIFGESTLAVSQVDIDDAWGARLATEHLLSLGCQDIVMVAGDGRALYMKHRIRGYIEAFTEAGGNPTIAYGSLDLIGGETAIRSFGRIPEAIFCASDGMAVGVLRNLTSLGIRIPIVGCDGLQLGEMTTPTLTSIKLPFYEAGQKLAEAILDGIQGKEPVNIRIRPDLVIRESTHYWEGRTSRCDSSRNEAASPTLT